MCEETGPPTLEDSAWYTHAVVSLGYPKVKRGDKPMEGQMTLTDVRPHSWMRPKGVKYPNEIYCLDCGLTTDPALKSRYDEEGCSFDIDRKLERVDADEQRAREDERDQFNLHPPE